MEYIWNQTYLKLWNFYTYLIPDQIIYRGSRISAGWLTDCRQYLESCDRNFCTYAAYFGGSRHTNFSFLDHLAQVELAGCCAVAIFHRSQVIDGGQCMTLLVAENSACFIQSFYSNESQIAVIRYFIAGWPCLIHFLLQMHSFLVQ